MPEQSRTLVYIHGIGNKPPAAVLKRQWDGALFGRDMGARTRMAYWADIRYPHPLSPGEGDFVDAEAAGTPRTRTLGTRPASTEDFELELPNDEARDYAARIAARFDAHSDYEPRARTLDVHKKILPRFMRGIATRLITRAFIEDTAAYFYNVEQREQMRDRLRALLPTQGGPYIVVAHSQGTIIAYDVLTELSKSSPTVPLLITLGSPLGVKEVQDRITKPLAIPGIVGHWSNFADPFDPVALDKDVADEYGATSTQTIDDHKVWNRDTTRIRGFNPHSGTGYLATGEVQRTVREEVGTPFLDATAPFVIAKDVAADMADQTARIPVLIELDDETLQGDLATRRDRLASELQEIVRDEDARAGIDKLSRYIAADLTSQEIDRIVARHGDLTVSRVWRNARKRALLDRSVQVVQASTAHIGYGAFGDRIHWAVLDTGVNEAHPHFRAHDNVAAKWDCTKPGKPVPDGSHDRDGHGTHVAGIIAGEHQLVGETLMRGMAPKAKIHAYKVLSDEGEGKDSWIIKAIDHIAALNDDSPNLRIHGVNLSLGGPFEAEVYACGHSALCKELRRLWRQGVVVCIAAGNEGQIDVQTAEGLQALNFDLSISDPANLEDAIAVGSVSTDAPHLYGISFFSSRGPTADGRAKPDLVAPGERIRSCNAKFNTGDLYVPMSGTSMACPHVSGMLASFLSVRREFIGHPDHVKQILLTHCTDLKRDRYHQGAGMPNLLKMLADS